VSLKQLGLNTVKGLGFNKKETIPWL